MSTVSDNLKTLRKHHRYTQEQFAKKIGIKRSLLGAYEEGRADPRLANLEKIAETFDVSIDVLITQNLQDLPAGQWSRSSATEKGVKVLSITVDQQDRENIELVPQKASAGYTNGYADPEFIEDLPRFQLPNLPTGATYRAFEISGDSMLPLQSGTIIIGKYIESINDIKNGQTYVVVTQSEGVVYKRLEYDQSLAMLTLKSDNKAYEAYQVEAAEVVEIWEAKLYISTNFPESVAMSTIGSADISLQKLTGMVLDLQHEMIQLKSK